MKRWASAILSILVYIFVHEGCHMGVSAAFGVETNHLLLRPWFKRQ